MIYTDACEAQGMTLADLIFKGSTAAIDSETVSLLWLIDNSPVNFKTNVVINVYNDTGAEWTYTDHTVKPWATVGFHSSEEGKQIQGTGVTITFVNSIRTGGPEVWNEYQYYKQFGLSQVVLPDAASKWLPAIWDRVCTRVNERYWKRYLACETLEEWQVLLQTMTDELAPRYERAFRMYAANSEASETEILAVMKTDYGTDGLTDTHTQETKGTSKTTVRDTPDGVINDTSSYAGTVTDGVTDAGTTKSTRKGVVTVTQTGSDGVLGRVNENIRLWRDLETDLVKEYASAFMTFIWA